LANIAATTECRTRHPVGGHGKGFPQNAKKAQEDESPRLPDQECLPIGQRALAEAAAKSKVSAAVRRWFGGFGRRAASEGDAGPQIDMTAPIIVARPLAADVTRMERSRIEQRYCAVGMNRGATRAAIPPIS